MGMDSALVCRRSPWGLHRHGTGIPSQGSRLQDPFPHFVGQRLVHSCFHLRFRSLCGENRGSNRPQPFSGPNRYGYRFLGCRFHRDTKILCQRVDYGGRHLGHGGHRPLCRMRHVRVGHRCHNLGLARFGSLPKSVQEFGDPPLCHCFLHIPCRPGPRCHQPVRKNEVQDNQL